MSKAPTVPTIEGPDGVTRTYSQERQLNEAFALAFRGEIGKLVLGYLEQQTFRTIIDPAHNTDRQLWCHEGKRHLVALIKTRVQEGENAGPVLPEPKET